MNKITLVLVDSWCIMDSIFRIIDGDWIAICSLSLGLWVIIWTIWNKQIKWIL